MATIVFRKTEEETKLFAIVVAQLIKEDVVFSVRSDDVGWEIHLSGGY